MSDSPSSRRAVAEIRTGENQLAGARVGNRSIHQFWYLFSPYFRHVLLAPHRRPDSNQVTWSWQEAAESRSPTAPELAEVRRRLTDASRALVGNSVDLDLAEGGRDQSLDAQVRRNLQEMITALAAKSDQALAGYVCRTSTGLMLHSWSASTPSPPCYPDSRQGGITGTVWLDGQTAAGVKIVLQNKQGADLDHTTTGRTGAFGFQHVAPGQYRVRASGRGEFPAEGLVVTVGREAVEGLELRGGSSDPAAARGASSAAAPSGPKRRWIAVLAVLALLGAGALVWRTTTQPAASPTADGKTPFGWQSASGKLAGPVGQAPVENAHKAGGAGSWSQLSRNLAPPKAVNTPRPRVAKAGFDDDRSPAPPAAERAGQSLRGPEARSAPGDSTEKNRLSRSDAKQPRGANRTGLAAAEPTDLNAIPADDVARDEPDEAGDRSPENKTSDLAPALAAKKRLIVPGSILSSVDNPSTEATSASGAQQTQAESVSAIPQGGSQSNRTARPTRPNGSGTADQSQVSAAAAESGRPTEAGPGSGGAESTDHAQNRPGARSKERAGLARATATTANTSAASTGEATKENTEPAPPETGNDQASSKSPARTNQPAARPAETPSRSAERSLPGGRADDEAESTPDTPAPAEEPAKPAAAAGKTARAPAASVPALANPAEANEPPSVVPDSAPLESDANPIGRSSRPGRKNPSSKAADSQTATESVTPANGLAPRPPAPPTMSARPASG